MNNKLRHFIIEYSLLIEELVSETLGNLLNLDWKNSKSFGFGSSSLSFNQKTQIIQDVRGVNSLDSKKLSHFIFIRNKFAHVREIETFNDLFIKTKNGKEIKNFFDKHYMSFIWPEEIKEINSVVKNPYTFCFAFLCKEIIDLFINICEENSFNRGYEKGVIGANKKMVDLLIQEVMTIKEGKDVIIRVLDKLKMEE